jgi:acetyltransferase-like isoleucine patch superfamily enzyme
MTEKTETHSALTVFLSGSELSFEFDTKCDISERVEYIYSIIFPGIGKMFFYLRFAIGRLAGWMDYSPLKVFLYRLMGVKIGKGVFISPDVYIDPHFPDLIELEDYSIIGQFAIISCHEYAGYHYRLGRVKIGRGAVIGHSAIIMPGSQVSPMTCVPMRSILSKNTPQSKTYDFSDKYR